MFYVTVMSLKEAIKCTFKLDESNLMKPYGMKDTGTAVISLVDCLNCTYAEGTPLQLFRKRIQQSPHMPTTGKERSLSLLNSLVPLLRLVYANKAKWGLIL